MNSGHQFNQIVKSIFRDIDVQIEVDDFLLEASNISTMASKLRNLLQRARDRGVAFAKRKLQFGKQVNFAGLTISKGTCIPMKKKTTAIAAFPHPTNMSELRKFHRLLQCLHKFIPDLQHMMRSSHDLLKKDVPWIWT